MKKCYRDLLKNNTLNFSRKSSINTRQSNQSIDANTSIKKSENITVKENVLNPEPTKKPRQIKTFRKPSPNEIKPAIVSKVAPRLNKNPPNVPAENKMNLTVPKTSKKAPSMKSDRSDKSSSKGGNLSGRKDVVYKTLLRSVKRYYSSEFEEMTEYSSLTKSKQEKTCIEIILKFTRTMFSEDVQSLNKEPSDDDTIRGVNLRDVAMFILSLVVPSYIKRNLKSTPIYKTYDVFYECLYRYSHKRLEAALAIPCVA